MWRIFLLLLLIVILYVVLQYSENTKEGFALDEASTDEGPTPTIRMCPVDPQTLVETIPFLTKNSDQNCCNGDVLGTKCNGKVICTLTKPRKGGVPSCSYYLKNLYNTRTNTFCPKSLPRYFNDQKGNSGCTVGPLKSDYSAPLNANQEKCIIYKTEKDDIGKPDSCYLIKKLDTITCPTPLSTKSITQEIPSCNFKDNDGKPRMCHDTESLIDYLMTNRNLSRKSAIQSIEKDPISCDYAKKIFIEKSIPSPIVSSSPPVKITWADVQQTFPGSSSIFCYSSQPPNPKCYDILSAIEEEPNSNLTKMARTTCMSALYQNDLCKKIITNYAPPKPAKITWDYIKEIFPGVTSQTCYSELKVDSRCKDIVTVIKEEPNNPLSIYVKAFCMNMPYQNEICKEILTSPAATAATSSSASSASSASSGKITWADVQKTFPGTTSGTCYGDVNLKSDSKCYDIVSAIEQDPTNPLSTYAKAFCMNMPYQNDICKKILTSSKSPAATVASVGTMSPAAFSSSGSSGKITWADVQQTFPGTSSGTCYGDVNLKSDSKCYDIVKAIEQDPSNPLSTYAKAFCMNMPYQNDICKKILTTSKSPAAPVAAPAAPVAAGSTGSRATPLSAAAPVAPAASKITWADVQKTFPGTSSGSCYGDVNLKSDSKCYDIVKAIKEDPTNPLSTYAKAFCMNMPYKNDICKKILS